MTRHLAVALLSFSLAGCAAIGASPDTGAVANYDTQVVVAKSEHVAEEAYSVATQEYLNHQGDVTPATKATAKRLLQAILNCDGVHPCTGALVAARAADAAGSATTLNGQIEAVRSLAGQVLSLVHSTRQLPPETN